LGCEKRPWNSTAFWRQFIELGQLDTFESKGVKSPLTIGVARLQKNYESPNSDFCNIIFFIQTRVGKSNQECTQPSDF